MLRVVRSTELLLHCDSVTVDPMVHVLIFAEDSAVRRNSVIMMSDDLKHVDTYAVYMFT